MNLIITISGVLNNTNSINNGISILGDKIVLVQKIVEETGVKCWLYDEDTMPKNFYHNMFKLMGLKYGLAGNVNAKNIQPILNRKYVIITSDITYKKQRNVVITNYSTGLQESDVRTCINLLNGIY